MSWYCLGLGILLNSVIWLILVPAEIIPAFMTLLVGLIFFLTPLIKKFMPDRWGLMKDVLHILVGFFIILGAAFYVNWILDDFVGNTTYNHYMPHFIFIGGGLAVVFGVVLFMYGFLNTLKDFGGALLGEVFGKLARVFYMLMVLVFLLGITFNVTSYLGAFAWGFPMASASIQFFAGMLGLAGSNLVAILLIILYIYGMGKIVEKFQ